MSDKKRTILIILGLCFFVGLLFLSVVVEYQRITKNMSLEERAAFDGLYTTFAQLVPGDFLHVGNRNGIPGPGKIVLPEREWLGGTYYVKQIEPNRGVYLWGPGPDSNGRRGRWFYYYNFGERATFFNEVDPTSISIQKKGVEGWDFMLGWYFTQ